MVYDDGASEQENPGNASSSFALLGKPDTSDMAANVEPLPAAMFVAAGSCADSKSKG